MENLQLILVIYVAVMLVNLGISLVYWRSYKNDLYKMSFFLWLTYFFYFATQAALIGKPTLMAFAFATCFPFAIVLRRILDISIPARTLRDKSFYIIFSACMGLSFLFAYLDFGFTIISLPIAVGVTLPMFDGAIRVLRSGEKLGTSTKILSIFVIINSLHLLDFPFLRLTDFAPYGFSLAFVLILALSLILPAHVMSEVNKRYIEQLESKNLMKDATLGHARGSAKEYFDILDQEVLMKLNSFKEIAHKENLLLSTLAHDINGALQSIMLSSNLLSRRIKGVEDEEEYQKLFGKIDKSVTKILEMIKSVRSVQKISAQATATKVSECIICELEADLMNYFEDSIRPKNIELKFNYEFEKMSILGDVDVVKNHILTNLISNAVKFSYKDSFIRVILKEELNHYFITVEDDGLGMDEFQIANIFDIEKSVSRRGTSGEKGSGIGLSLVKRYVELCSGEIAVNSAPGAGSRFVVKLKKGTSEENLLKLSDIDDIDTTKNV